MKLHTRQALAFVAIFTLLALSIVVKKATMVTEDPLLNSGLSVQQTRLYRYLIALHSLSHYESKIVEATDAEAALHFIDTNPASTCIVCGRWFLAEIAICPFHGVRAREVSRTELEVQVEKWEDFRKRLVETSRIRGVTRVIAIRTHYFLDHPGER